MIIEIFGLPGAGKSTLAQALAEKNNFKVIKIRNKGELIFLNLVYLFKHPIKAYLTFYYLVKNSRGLPDFYYKFTNTFLHHNAKYQKALKTGKAILDQGYFQNLLSVFRKPLSHSILDKYLRSLLLPDKLIILDISLQASRERLNNRGWQPRKDLSQQDQAEWLEAVETNYRFFLKNIDKAKSNYTIIDANRDVDSVYNDVSDQL